MDQEAHKERMEREVSRILAELSGIEPENLDPRATFLELGFESLSLTQVSLAVKREFEVDLGFRELLETYRTPAALSGHLAGEVEPPEATPASDAASNSAPAAVSRPDATAGRAVPEPVLEAPAEGAPVTPPSGGSEAEGLVRVIRRQLRMMNQQLELLAAAGRSSARAETRREETPREETPRANERPEPSSEPRGITDEGPETDEGRAAHEGSETDGKFSEDGDEERHGPWQPMDHSREDGLTDRQRKHVRELVARMEERMPGSKRLTQETRWRLSDPRTVEGFRKAWKEAVMPVVSERSDGAYVWDVDGNRYVDIAMGFGVALLGHHPPFVRDALRERLDDGFAIGPQTPLAGEVAGLVHELTGMERVAFCNTGSEAVLAAIRTARTVTGRTRIATFRGDYHGIFDEMLARGIELGGERKTLPIAPGIPPHMVQAMTILDYGEDSALEAVRDEADELAAVLVEPVQSRHPDHQPADFLRKLRTLTEELDVPLILDEMITGFRSHPGGIQALWGVDADLATYGKVAGGGMPIGIVAGKGRFLDALDGGHWEYGDDSIPEAGVTWFAGTFVRHPLSLAAARATLQHLKERGPSLQEELSRRTADFVDELNARFEAMGAPLHVESFSSLFKVDFLEGPDAESLFYFHLKARGVHVTEGRAAFLSTAHSDADIEHLLEAFTDSVRALQHGGFLPAGGTAGDTDPEDSEHGASERPGRAGEATAVDERTVRVGARQVREMPLTEGQKEIWLATRVGEDANRAFNLANEVRLDGPLDAEALRKAVRDQVDRHEALRTTIHARGADGREGPVQRIHPVMPVEVPLVDLSELERRTRQDRLEELRREEVEHSFDVDAGPLFRARLARLAPREHVLLFTAHHVIADGWSCGVLLRHIGEAYRSICRGERPTLDEPTQLSEYVRLEHESRTSPAGRDAERFWLELLGNDTPVLELPTDRPRPGRKTYRAARIQRSLASGGAGSGDAGSDGQESDGTASDGEGDLRERIRSVSTRSGATTFAMLYAAFRVLLHRLTGQDDLVLGVSAAGQAMVGAEELVGDCVNTLPVRSRHPGDRAPFRDHLGETRSLLLDAFEHQQCTFGTLIEKLELRRDPGRVPLVSVLFNLDPTLTELDFGEPRVSARSVPRAFEIFDLFFNVVIAPDDFRVECTYNTDLLDRETVEGWLEAYATILDEATADPGRTLAELRPAAAHLQPRGRDRTPAAPSSRASPATERLPLRPDSPSAPDEAGSTEDPKDEDRATTASGVRTGIGMALADQWASLLGVEPGEPGDDFFLLGGHSLLAMRLLTWIETELGVDLSLGTFLENSTLASLTRLVRSELDGGDRQGERKPDDPKPASAEQRETRGASGGSPDNEMEEITL